MTGQRRGPRRWRRLLAYRRTWLSNDLIVRAPQHRKRAALLVVVLALAGWGCLFVITSAPYGAWYRGVASGLLGSFIGMGCLAAWKKQTAYKQGWIEGRLAMVRALREAYDRGMSIPEWLEGEWHRDAVLMGLDPATGESRSERRKHEQVRARSDDGRGWRGLCLRGARWLGFHVARRQRGADDPATPGGGRVQRGDRQAP